MLKQLSKKNIFKNKFIAVIALLVVISGGYFGYQAISGSKKAVRYTLAAVEKSTLIVSVSGSGQIVSLDEVEITPKISGKLAALHVAKDQTVKAGQLVATLDSSSAEKAVRDARISLDEAKYALEQAKQDYQDIETDANRTLTKAYEDGYDTVSTVFFKLSDYMKDLKDVLGTEKNAQEYIAAYELALGKNSLFIQKLLEDYESANILFNKNFAFFRTVFREDNHDTIYQLISRTLETTKAISQALDSARHMFDAISLYDYQHICKVASQMSTMQPKIQSDVSAVYGNISSLQSIKDTIDDTNKNTPGKIEKAKRAVQTAQNNVIKKEEALADAEEELEKCSIYAPFNGIIASVGNITTAGETVSTNTVLFTLITREKIAKITLNEVDAAKVKIGQKATLTFDALPEISIAGRVADVDTVGTVSQGVVSYGVKITFDSELNSIKPGMSVTAEIITDVKQEALILPNSAVKSQGDAYYVELVEASSEEMRQNLLKNKSGLVLPQAPKLQVVQIGLSNDTSTEILSGLKEGDIVVVSKNTSNNTAKSSNKNSNTSRRQTPELRMRGMGF